MTASLFWRAGQPLVLASGSASRASMLAAAGVPFEVQRPQVDERALEAPLLSRDAPASAIALALAEAKALSVSCRTPGRWTLGADQTLDLDGELFHKAANRDEAVGQLARLAGKRHRLTSAAVLARDGIVLEQLLEVAIMTMRPLGPAEIAHYLDNAGPTVLGGVGCYQIEGLGVHLFESIEGDVFTIRGLPLLPLLGLLRSHGALA